MPMTLQGILQIGTSSLTTYQTGLAITSNNISNANTAGYSRQRMNLQEGDPLTTIPGQLGEGVQVTSVTRLNSSYIDNAVHSETGQQSKYQQVNQDLQNLEGVFGDPTNPTLSADLTSFFNTFQTLSTNPQDMNVRQSAIEAGDQISSDFQTATAQITEQQSGLDTQVNQAASDINSLLTNVASLNQQITTVQQHGQQPNDLLDQRDLAITNLSKYMDLDLSTDPASGALDVSVNGQALVTGFTASSVAAVDPGLPGHPDVEINGTSLATNGGQLAGFAQSYGNIDQTQASLDDLAGTVITQVNAVHDAGFDLNGNAGLDFFSGSDASSISVNAAIQNDPTKIAASGTGTAGDNTAALAMVALQDQPVFPSASPTSTLSSGISTLVVQLGSQAQQSGSLATIHQNTLTSLQQQQSTISGVSTDEELTNMMQYQRAYQAAARVITTVDDCMSTVINMGSPG